MGTVLPWEYGGLNLPGTTYRMMIEVVARAEAGLMAVFRPPGDRFHDRGVRY